MKQLIERVAAQAVADASRRETDRRCAGADERGVAGHQSAQDGQDAATGGQRALVLVVGAGSGADLASWRALKPRRLLLLEPQSSMTRTLSSRLRPSAGEALLEAALVTTDQPTVPLYVLSNPRESGLSQPTGLLEHFPNLKLKQIQDVPAVRLGPILAALGADEPVLDAEPDAADLPWPEDAVLIVEAPWVMANLARDNPQLVARFEWVALRSGEQALFEGDVDADALRHTLQLIGFTTLQASDEAIPPYVEWLFQRQPLAPSLWQARHQMAQLTAQRDRLAGERSVLATRCEALQSEAQTLSSSRDALLVRQAEIAAERAALADQVTSLIASRDQLAGQGAELTAVRDGLLQEKAELTGQRDALAKEKAELVAARDAQAQLAAERQAQVEALGRDKSELTAARDGLAKDKSSLQAQLDEARQQLETGWQQQQELTTRQQLMQEELVKAEAQIELIKDLLLREPSL